MILAWRIPLAWKTNERETKPRAEPGVAIDVCLFGHRPADAVTFVVRDRVHGYNVCADCIDDCARTVACSCVC